MNSKRERQIRNLKEKKILGSVNPLYTDIRYNDET